MKKEIKDELFKSQYSHCFQTEGRSDDIEGSLEDFQNIGRASWVSQLVKNLPTNAGDARDEGSIPGSGRSPGEGNSNTLQYSCHENLMDREAWWATVHRVANNWT